MEAEENGLEGDSNNDLGFGFFNYVITYSKYTHTPLELAFDVPAMLVFITICYIIKENEIEKKRIQEWKNKH